MTSADAHPVPDQHGTNLFDTDPDLGRLLPLYLPAPLLQHLLPHLRQLGGQAGGVLDTLAQTGRPEPAAAAAPHAQRRRRAAHRQAPGLRGDGAYGLQRIRPGGDVAPRRRARLACAAAGGRQVRADLPVRAGRVRPVLPAVDDRFADAHAAQVRHAGAGRALPAAADDPGLRRAVPGRDVHDRTGRRLRRRGDRHPRRCPTAMPGACTATSGSAPTPMPTWRWCWRASTGRRPACRACRCSCCRAPWTTARPTPTASCG